MASLERMVEDGTNAGMKLSRIDPLLLAMNTCMIHLK